MSYPRIRFRVSAKQDLATLYDFAKDAKHNNGRFMQWAIFSNYPHLKFHFDNNFKVKDEKVLYRFIFETYRTKQISMRRALSTHKKRWEKIAPHYFSLINSLFAGRKWPRGKYIAFGTIWGMYPRFLEDKTFQIPFWHRTPRYVPVVIAHELLHFMFYDYFYERYPKYRQPKNNFFVWHVSEIFNTVVQNSPAWLRCFKLKSRGYPEHKKIVKYISRIWYPRNVWHIDALVDDIMKEIRKKKPVP